MIGKDTQPLSDKEAGTILLETLLVLPIYMVLLGGIFWIGELAFTRHTLLSADRLAAWSMGNRLAHQSEGQVESLLKNEKIFEEAREQELEVKDGKSDLLGDVSWWKRSHAYAQATQRIPVWAEGWYAASWQEGDADVEAETEHSDTEMLLRGRTNIPGGFIEIADIVGEIGCPTEGHVVLMRTKDGLANLARNTFKVLTYPLVDTMFVPSGLSFISEGRNTETVLPALFMPLEFPPD